MAKQITPAIFFRELYSYMGYSGELASTTEYIQGLGEIAVTDIPEVYDKFGSVRGMLQLRWDHTFSQDDSAFSKREIKAVPLITDVENKTATLFLPATQIRIPMDVVVSDTYNFRDDHEKNPVNIVVYKDPLTPNITIAMLLRNNKVSPWTTYFSYLIDKITRTANNLTLNFPRVDINTTASSKSICQVPVRITGFSLADISSNTCVATLNLIPDNKGMKLFSRMGL